MTAIAAAGQAAEAAAELIRFDREGPHARRPFGEVDVVAGLAEALQTAARIEQDHLDSAFTGEEREALAQLAHACGNYLADWAG